MKINVDTRLLMNYRRLRDIKRCNNFPVLHTEDVAQHSYFVTIIALTLADEYNSWVKRHNILYHPLDFENSKALINVEEILRKALLHDTDEAFTSDIPWNIKHSNEETHKAIELAIQKRVNDAYEQASPLFSGYKHTARNCKDGFVGGLLNIADMLELAVYCYEEYTSGNNWIESLLKKSVELTKKFCLNTDFYEACPTLKQLIAILESMDKKHVTQLIDVD